MSAAVNHYERLGVRADASTDEIRRAFRALAKTAHPDAGGDPEAFLLLREAHDTLTDPERRRDHDRALGIRTGVAGAGAPDAGWSGRAGDFTGDVEFPAWMRDLVDGAWQPAGPDDDPLAGAAGGGTGRGGTGEEEDRTAAVRWWWPHEADRPAVGGAGLVLCSAGSVVAAVDVDTGRQLSTIDLGAPQVGLPALTEDGGLAVAVDAAGGVHGLDPRRGAPRWRVRLKGTPRTGPQVAGGVVLVAAGGRLLALDPATGSARWTSRLSGDALDLVPLDDLAVVVTDHRSVEALDLRKGRHRWVQRNVPRTEPPPVAATGTVWLGVGGRVVRLDRAVGSPGPTVRPGLAVTGLVGTPTRVLVTASGPPQAVAADGDGRVRWSTPLPAVALRPVVVGDAVVLVCADRWLRTLDLATGRLRGEAVLPLDPTDDPVAVGEVVVLRDRAGAVWAVHPVGV